MYFLLQSKSVGKVEKQQEVRKDHGKSPEQKQMSFQGQKINMKKKKKDNKLNKKRKEMAGKLIATMKTKQA